MKPRIRHALVAAGAVATSTTLGALASPKEGSEAPDAKLEDVEGRVARIKAMSGKPLLIVYEDRDSAKQNEALKKELGELARGDRFRSRVALAAVADVSAWDFWPAKGFVKDAIRDESRKQGTTIYCDWTGAFRDAFKMRKGVSNVVLLGKDGRVAFAAEGALPPEQRRRLVAILREQIDGG